MAFTAVKCPECGDVSRIPKAVSPGTKVRCSGCKAVFPFRSSPDDAFDGLSDFDENPAPLHERLGPVRGASAEDGGDMSVGRYGSISNQSLGLDQEITIDRMALKSERTKDRLRGGKPQRFEGSRKFLTAIVIVVIAGIGYLFFWLFYDFAKEAGNAQKLAQEAKAKKFQDAQRKSPKVAEKSKIKSPDVAPKVVDATPRTTAPTPVRINDLVIGIRAAKITRVAMKTGVNNNYYLALSVQIDNRSGQSVDYEGWHYARNLPVLRDAKTKATYPCSKFMPVDLPRDCVSHDEIPAGGSIVDLLVFAPPEYPYPSLELDLPSPVGNGIYRYYIPIEMIEVVEEEPAQVADAQPQPGLVHQPAPKPEAKRPLNRDDQIRAEYFEKWSEVLEVAKEKASVQAANNYKRTKKVGIQEQLVKKYKVTKEELKSILPR